MADPINRLAMFSAPVDDQVNMLAPQLPAGHPSNMLMWIRDQIPQVQADDSSTMSGIYSRLGRTATAIPRAGLETMANWLRGVDDPNAVRIGEDTIAPLGLFGMAGLAGRGATAAKVMADNAKSSVPGTVVNAMGEQPQTIRAYHGTNAKFDRFDPAYTDEVGFHFGSKEQAEARLRDKADEEGRRRLPWPFSNERTIPVDIEAKKILDLKEDPNSFGGDLLSLRLLLDEHMQRSKYDEVQGMVKAGRDAEATAAVRQWITDNGYDVVRYPNKVEGAGAQPSYMTMGTGNVRDARTGKVLFSDPASSPSLAASASQQPDSGVLDILSRYGLY